MDSDSDLQAYINELSRKTHDLQLDIDESELVGESSLSHSSFIEIDVAKSSHGKYNNENVKKPNLQNNKVKELEEKYLKKASKLTKQDFSLSMSFSEYDVEFEEEKFNSGNVLLLPDDGGKDLNGKTKSFDNENKIEKLCKNHTSGTKNEQIENINTFQSEIKNLKSENFEEEINENISPLSNKNIQRKLSDTSLLLHKSNIFYSSEDKAGRRTSQGRIIFRRKSSILSESDTIKSESTKSVSEEEIPELEGEKIILDPLKSKEIEVKDPNYRKDTFESSETSSVLEDKTNYSETNSELTSVSKTQSSANSLSSAAATTKKLSKKNKTSDKSQSTRSKSQSDEDSSPSSTKQSSNSKRYVDRTSDDDYSQSSSKNQNESTSDRSDTSLVTSSKSKKSSSQCSIEQKSPKRKQRSEISIEKVFRDKQGSSKTNRKSIKAEKTVKDKKRSEMKSITQSSSSSSSTIFSSSASSSSSSFDVKIKQRKYREKKKKLKQEKELTELIIKLLIKNLPMILQQSMSMNWSAELVQQQQQQHTRKYICHNCGGDPIGLEINQRRIDDALRQTVDLTRQFLESHKALMQVQVSQPHSTYRYTTLRSCS